MGQSQSCVLHNPLYVLRTMQHENCLVLLYVLQRDPIAFDKRIRLKNECQFALILQNTHHERAGPSGRAF